MARAVVATLLACAAGWSGSCAHRSRPSEPPSAPVEVVRPRREPIRVIYSAEIDGPTVPGLHSIDREAGTVRIVLFGAHQTDAWLDTISLADGTRIDRAIGTRDDATAAYEVTPPCDVLSDGTFTRQKDVDHIELVAPDGTARQVDSHVPAAYRPCFFAGGKRLAWFGYSSREYHLFVTELPSLKQRMVPGTGDAYIGDRPLISDDGRWIYLIRKQMTPTSADRWSKDRVCFVRVDTRTLEAADLVCHDRHTEATFAISPDQRHAVFFSAPRYQSGQGLPDCHAQWIDLPTGDVRATYDLPCGMPSFRHGWLSDDGMLLANSRAVIDLSTGERARDLERSPELHDNFSSAAWLEDGVLLLLRTRTDPRTRRQSIELIALDLRSYLESTRSPTSSGARP